MSQKIQIICSSPGMRRLGVEHPASKIYDAGHWTDAQIATFKADPAFTVVEGLSEGGVPLHGADINAAVTARVELIQEEMQAQFTAQLAAAVAEKTAELKAAHDNEMDKAGKAAEAAEQRFTAQATKLEEVEAKVTDLEAKLAEAKKATAKTAAK